LGLVEGEVRKFPTQLMTKKGERLKIPHMGWNSVSVIRRHPVLEGVQSSDEFYFVHSYYPVPFSDQIVIGETDYGLEFSSVIGRRNLIAMQFHPEKSGVPGLRLLKNFCTWNGNP